jgi:hypothetical protein
MKFIKYTTLALITSVFMLSSCEKLKNLASVNLNLSNTNGEFSIPIISTSGSIDITTENIYMNIDSMIQAEDAAVHAKHIKEVRITGCRLELIDGDRDNNFSAIQSCKMELASNASPDFITIAEIQDNPDVEKYNLELPISNPDLELKKYFTSSNQFSYKVHATTRKPTTKPLNGKIVVSYKIKAGL